MVNADPLSSDGIDMIKGWRRECDSSHPNCNQIGARPQLPTHIIDVGSSDDSRGPYLLISNGTQGEYIALSHVWGGHISLRTLSSNIDAHCSSIPLGSLPKTFLDAIKVTHVLGYRYLWIDSLCIVQDSKRDWEIECTKMAHIYSKSSIVLAAVDTPNSTIGFLRPRVVAPYAELPHSESSSLRIMPMRDHCADDLRDTLLDHRSWCYQEQVLGPRILAFGKEMTTWDCRGASFVEAASVPRPEKLKLTVDGAFGNDIVRTSWIRIVILFSQRAITKADDRLPALSGIARQFAEKTGYHYCAGLWQESLMDELGWAVEKNEYRPLGQDGPPKGTPSWSWASHVSGTAFPDRIRLTEVKILEVKVKLAGLDPFGQVDRGSLILRGKTRMAYVRYQSENPKDFLTVTYADQQQSLRDNSNGEDVGRCSFDDWSSPLIQGPEHGNTSSPHLLCLQTTRGHSHNHALLLIVSANSSETYLRVGVCTTEPAWFDGAVTQTIIVV